MRSQCLDRRRGIGAAGAGDEDDVGMGGGVVDAGGGRARIDHDDGTTLRLRRDEGAVGAPVFPLEGKLLILRPQALHDRREFRRHRVALVMRDWVEPEHAELAFLVAGDHVKAPAAAAHMVDDGAVFC